MKKRKSEPPSVVPKMIPNPAYQASDEHRQKVVLFKDTLARMGECVEDYFPAEYGKDLPVEGAWIMLLMSVHVGKANVDGSTTHITVPHLSMWYALPTLTRHTREFDGVKMPMTQAIIHTLGGDVHVWPHEYQRVEDLTKYLEFTEEEGFHIRFLHPETAEFDRVKLFYLRSRGISEAQAKRMLLPELNNPNFCYFQFDEAYSDIFGEGCGTPYLHSGNHRRRVVSARQKAANDL
jgi:hypothetical protein